MRMNLRRNKWGQATVEFALVVPLFLWLMVALVDASRLAGSTLIVQHAAREGVRLGVTGADDADIEARVLSSAEVLDPAEITVVITPAGTRNTGDDITVSVTYNYQVVAVPDIWGTEVPVSSQLTARVE